MTAPPDRIWAWNEFDMDFRIMERWTDSFHDDLPHTTQEYILADLLSDPVAVHLNMLRGTIAKPSLAQIAHIYGDEWTATIAAAEARGLRMAADALDKKHRGDLPEHIKSEDGEFVRALITTPPAQ